MRFALAVAVALTSTALLAQPRTYEIRKDPKNLVEFHAEDTYDAFDGKTNNVTGTIVADPAKASASKVDISIDLASLDTGISLRNSEMRNRYLQTPRFPAATFKSVSVAASEAIVANQPVDLKVTGDLTLHGVTKRMTLPVRVVLFADGRIHVTSQFNIHMPDFDIHVPKNILVTVDDMIPVRMDLWAVAK
ncbi:MAG: YceI family protein [Acidobacteriota bacterium]